MKRALITGSSGHVGSNLVRKLSELDYKIRCIDFDGDHRAYEGYDVEIIKGDITDKDSLYEIFEGVDVVFHTAALINLDRRYREAIEFVNIEGTRNVCEVALEKVKAKNEIRILESALEFIHIEIEWNHKNRLVLTQTFIHLMLKK